MSLSECLNCLSQSSEKGGNVNMKSDTRKSDSLPLYGATETCKKQGDNLKNLSIVPITSHSKMETVDICHKGDALTEMDYQSTTHKGADCQRLFCLNRKIITQPAVGGTIGPTDLSALTQPSVR